MSRAVSALRESPTCPQVLVWLLVDAALYLMLAAVAEAQRAAAAALAGAGLGAGSGGGRGRGSGPVSSASRAGWLPLRLRGLTHRYPGAADDALRDFSLEVAAGAHRPQQSTSEHSRPGAA